MFFAQSVLFEKYLQTFTSPHSGFLPRYGVDSVLFRDNIAVLKDYPLGIGFTIIGSGYEISYTDSGYLVAFAMGGLAFPVGMYTLLLMFLKANISRQYRLYIVIAILLFEVAIPVITYVKFFPLIIFVVQYLKSIDSLSS